MRTFTDKFNRTINYLRVSITDRCNLRCVYCMPPHGVPQIQHKDILQYEEISRILRSAVRLGLRRIRITGGEPLIRKNVVHLIRLITKIEGIEDISLTTNGILLEQYAGKLAEAGLKRVNISLDSLIRERYRDITRGGDFDIVLRGIKAAEKAGLNPIKINMVPIRGLNDDEILDFAKLTLDVPYQIRFIEFMPFGKHNMWKPERFISVEEMRIIVEDKFSIRPFHARKSGPARYFQIDGAQGLIGFISPLSNHFCAECNRLRLTADGKIKPCLFSDTEIDLKPALKSHSPDSEMSRLLELSIKVKPEGHNINMLNTEIGKIMQNRKAHNRLMSRIGG